MKEILISLILDNLLPVQVVSPIFCAATLVFFKQEKISSFFTQVYLLIGLSISFIIFITSISTNFQYVVYWFGNFEPTLGIEFRLSKLTSLFLFLISFLAFTGYFWGKKYLATEIGVNKIYLFNILYLIFYAGLLGISLTNDLFNIFVFIEIVSLSSYAIIGLNKSNKSSPFTTFNYLIISSVATSLYVLAVGIIYMLTGSLNLDIAANSLCACSSFNSAFCIAIILIILFLLIKVGIFPFSIWVAKVYSDTPTTFNPLMCGVASKILLLAITETIIIFITCTNNNLSQFVIILNYIAIFTIVIGAIIATFQSNLRSMLAWSSVSYIGYIFLIIFENNKALITSTLALVIWHSITKSGLFMVAGNINHLLGNTLLNNFGGIYKRSLFNFVAFIILSLSLIGFPGTLGFAVKWYLIVNLIYEKAYVSTLAVLFASSMSIFYIWQVIDKIIFGKPSLHHNQTKIPLSANIILGLLIFLTVILGVFGAYFIDFIYKIVVGTVIKF